MSEEVVVAKDKAEHAALATETIARAIHEAVQERGVARVALSGGSTPSESYQLLAKLALPFDRVHWYWVDERAVPKDDPRSNFGAAMRDFDVAPGAEGGPTPKGRFFRMPADASDLVAAAREYEALLRREFGVAGAVRFDALVLGVGDDGHTASLFPGLGVVGIEDRLVTAVPAQPDKGLEARLSLTAPVICEADLVVVLARGDSKRLVIEKARSPGPDEEIPARLVQRAKNHVAWLLDRAAAG